MLLLLFFVHKKYFYYFLAVLTYEFNIIYKYMHSKLDMDYQIFSIKYDVFKKF